MFVICSWGDRTISRTVITAIAPDLVARSAIIAISDAAKSPDAFNAPGLF
jgi:hypothetical protein